MSGNSIPSEEDYARAKAAMRANDRGLSAVRANILDRFKDSGLHNFFILYSPAARRFGAYVFFRCDRHVSESDNSGLSAKIRDSVLDELVAVGRGGRDDLDVTFEFDSHENVERNYDGDYYNRMR
jgi:hypothetical protein